MGNLLDNRTPGKSDHRRIDYLKSIKKLGIDGELQGDEFKFLCPFHNETDPSMSINIKSGKYHCFGCGEGGPFKKLVKAYKDDDSDLSDYTILAPPEILVKPRSTYVTDRISEVFSTKITLMKNQAFLSMTEDHSSESIKYLSSRGITKGMIDLFGIKDGREYMSEKVVFPVRDIAGRLLSAIGRSYTTNVQSKKVRNVPDTKAKNTLYGFYELLCSGYIENILILVEGPIDSISGQQCRYPTVGLLSMSVSDKQLELLPGYKIVLFLDKVVDPEIQTKLVKRISEVTDVRISRPKKYKDLNDALKHGGRAAVDADLKNYKNLF